MPVLLETELNRSLYYIDEKDPTRPSSLVVVRDALSKIVLYGMDDPWVGVVRIFGRNKIDVGDDTLVFSIGKPQEPTENASRLTVVTANFYSPERVAHEVMDVELRAGGEGTVPENLTNVNAQNHTYLNGDYYGLLDAHSNRVGELLDTDGDDVLGGVEVVQSFYHSLLGYLAVVQPE